MSALVWTLEGDDEDDDEEEDNDDEDEVDEILDFFFHHLEYHVNMICFRTAATPLDLVAAWKEGTGVSLHGGGMGRYLQRHGGTYQSALTTRHSPQPPQRHDSRCNVMQEAMEYGSIAVLDFLLDTLHYDIQMQCTDSSEDDDDEEDEEYQEEEPEQEEKDADRLETRDMDKEDNDNDPDTNNNNNKRLRTPLDVALDTFQDHSHELVLHLTNWGALTHRQWQYYQQQRHP